MAFSSFKAKPEPHGAPEDWDLCVAEPRDRSRQSQIDMDTLMSDLQTLRTSSHPLASALFQSLATSIQISAQLLRENRELRSSQQAREGAENGQRHKQEWWRTFWTPQGGTTASRSRSGSSSHLQPDCVPPGFPPQPVVVYPPVTKAGLLGTAFSVQVQSTGRTGGCEKHFVADVSEVLAGRGISLCVEDYKKTSESFLLIFCPIACRAEADIENALEGLGCTRKAILVVLHHKNRESARAIQDTERQVRHPALVQTVHACYTLEDGLYSCEMNEAAVATTADAIRSHAPSHSSGAAREGGSGGLCSQA